MLQKLFSRKKNNEIEEQPGSYYLVAKTGHDLLSSKKRSSIILRIKRLFSVTNEVWEGHYLYAIERFSELVQEVPASEIHHHSTEGGLIDHTLESLYSAVRISQGYILPPNAEPEEIAASSDRWRYGVFITILAHDIGKVVLDQFIIQRMEITTDRPSHIFCTFCPGKRVVSMGCAKICGRAQ